MTVNEVIKKFRITLCLEQKEFGEAIGVTKSSVSNYENGRRSPCLRTVRKMLILAKENKIKMSAEDFVN